MSPLLESTISGVVTALVWAVLALAYNHGRNLLLRRRLQQSFRWQGRGRTRYGFTIPITNRTSVPVIVRQVKLYEVYPSSSVRLYYDQPSNDVIEEPHPKMGEKQTEHTLQFPREEKQTERDFVELPAHTGASWVVLDKVVATLDWKFQACRVVIEYKTVFGNSKVIPVFADKDSVSYMTRDYKTHRDELLKRSPQGLENAGAI